MRQNVVLYGKFQTLSSLLHLFIIFLTRYHFFSKKIAFLFFNVRYSASSDVDEVFVPFLEKAYAKLHGVYESIGRGSIAEALVDLTGGSVTKIPLSSEKGIDYDQYVWDECVTFYSKSFIMGASLSDMSGRTEESEETMGLRKNLAYDIFFS